MKYVVTGATGFIGSAFVKLALELGHEVVAVCRPDSKSLHRLPNQHALSVVQVAMSDYDTLPSLTDSADVFVHFAWDGTSRCGRSSTDIQHQNVESTKEAIKAASRIGCKLFVAIGSQAEYGVHNGVITEQTTCNPVTEYGKAKLAVKEAGFQLSEKLSIKYMHLRVFSVFGPDDHPHALLTQAVDKMLTGQPLDLTPCHQLWNYLFVSDAATQIFRLSETAFRDPQFQHEVFNVASATTQPLRTYIERIRQLLHSDSQLNYGAITPQQIISLHPDISKTQSYTGFIEEYSFDEAITLTVKHNHEHNNSRY